MRTEKNLLSYIRYGAIILIIIFYFIIIGIFIEEKNNYLKEELKKTEITFINEHKKQIKSLVNRIHDFIKIEKDYEEKKLKSRIKEQVTLAYSIANAIYEKNSKDFNYSKEKTIDEIKTALREIRFNNDLAYMFINDMNGNNILNADFPQIEGTNLLNYKDSKGTLILQEINKQLLDKTETFYYWYWKKQNTGNKEFKKIGFVKKFEPYNIIIGASDYLDDFEVDIKKRVQSKINSIKFKSPEHIFIYDNKGVCLVNPKKELIGVNRYNIKNKEGRYVLRDILHFTLDNKEGFVSYKGAVVLNSKNLTNDKISYVKLFEDWQWMIGSGFYLEEMYIKLKNRQFTLEKSNDEAIMKTLIISFILLLILIITSFYLSRTINSIFLQYKIKLRKEAKEKERELNKSMRLYKDLFELNKSIILLIDPQTSRIVNANKSACEFYGYSKEELLSLKISDINILSEEECQKEIEDAVSRKRGYFNFIHKLKNGELKNIKVTSSLTTHLDIPVLYSVINDVSEEFIVKSKLKESETEFKALFEFSNIGLGIRDIEGNFLKINHKLADMLGYDESFLLNKNCIHISTHENLVEETNLFKKLINKEIKNYNIEKSYIRKDGTRFEAILTMAAVLNIHGDIIYVLSSIIDVSEMKEKDRLLVQQSKMATMGEMIGNIAHQWKQPLSLISMSNGLVKLNLEDNSFSTKDELVEATENINNSVQHLSATIDDFRNFFRPDKEKVFFNLREVFNKTYKLINPQLESNNILIIDDISDIEIFSYQNELLQVLINIVKNAKDELVTLERRHKRLLFITIDKKDNEAFIKIRDNAGGIPNKIIKKIFNAYFTTKEEKEGTGIGLYMSKQIIEGMGGLIEASNVKYTYENEDYDGAEFTVRLPL